MDETNGQPYTRRFFKPYGEVRGTKPTSWPNSRSCPGSGIDDTSTALTHLGAREYDPSAGRFLSADPVIDAADPLQINGYAYSHNNPTTQSDPTGLYDLDRMEFERQQERKKREDEERRRKARAEAFKKPQREVHPGSRHHDSDGQVMVGDDPAARRRIKGGPSEHPGSDWSNHPWMPKSPVGGGIPMPLPVIP
ncbi:RHS repeat domain-containing protein [Streptomyces sp. 900105755]